MGKGGSRNDLFVIRKRHTLHIRWLDFGDGPVVYSCVRLGGRIRLSERLGYGELDGHVAAGIMLAAINGLQDPVPCGARQG